MPAMAPAVFDELVAGMNRLAPDAPPLDAAAIRAQIAARDGQL